MKLFSRFFKIFVFLALFFSFFSIFKTNHAYAQTHYLISQFLSNNRSNIIWEVGYRNMGCLRVKHPSCGSDYWESTITHRVLVSESSCGSYNRCKSVSSGNLWLRTRPNYGVRWSTACKDPIANAQLAFTWGDFQIHTLSENITCRQSDPLCYLTTTAENIYSNNGGGILRFLGWGNTSNCPRYECNPGATTSPTCGTGANRCRDVWRVCNSDGQWVTRVSSNLNPDCRGVDGCCLQNSNCSGGEPYCGNGTDACSRYEPFCNSNRQCAVRTLSTESTYCANNTYWACLGDGECGERYCRNPNPCGICTDYDQISGRVFVDFDRNNQYDSGIDTPLRNATVQRSPTGTNNWSSSTTTNNSGYYIFNQLRNPQNQDVRIREAEFGLYDSNNCDYTNIIRSKYQGNVQTSPGHRRNNIDPTPNLSGVLFMLRYRSYDIIGTVYRDADNDGEFSSGDVRVNNNNIRIRSNETVTNDFHGSAFLDSNGNYSIPQHINGKSYDIALVQSTLPTGWSVVRSRTAIGSNKINGVTINCANSRGNDFLVTNLRPALEAPDLTIDSFIVPDAQVGTSTTASLVIANYGTTGTGNPFTVTVDNGAGTTRSSTQLALGSNARRPVDIIIPVTTEGTYTARARVDTPFPNGVIAESDETNNQTTTDYEVTGEVTTGVDLVVDDLSVMNADIGTTTTGSVIIANRGSAGTGSGFSILLSNGAGYTITEGHPALGAGDTGSPISFTLNVPATAGPYTAQATVNPSRTITETNYGNNTRGFEYNANFVPPTYSIQGGVFEDLNGDGFKNIGESYLSGTVNISGVRSYESSAPNGFTATDLPVDDYIITFDAQNDLFMGWEALSTSGIPLTIPPNPSFEAQPGDFCGTTHEHAECLVSGDIIRLNFPVRKIPAEPWFYGIGGDMRSDQTLENRIPEAANTYFSDREGGILSGIIFYQNGLTINPLTSLTARYSNPNNWLVRKSFRAGSISTSYESMESLLRKNGVWDSGTSISGANILSSINSGVFRVSGNASIPDGTYNVPAGVQAVYMITGSLNINASRIIIPYGSSIMFITREDIVIAENVTEIHGVYSANKSVIVRGLEDGITPDESLYIEGSIIGNAGRATSDPFDRRRDLYEANEQLPIIIINYRPDFVLNAPPYIKSSNYSIKEVAPGSQ